MRYGGAGRPQGQLSLRLAADRWRCYLARVMTPFGELPNRLARDMSLVEQEDWLARRISRRVVLQAGAAMGAGAALLGSAGVASAAGPPNKVLGRQIVYGADPSTEMVVAFAVTSAFTSASVTATGDGHDVHGNGVAQVVPGSDTRYVRATLTALRAGTTYSYTITIDGASGFEWFFHRRPLPDRMRFASRRSETRVPVPTR